LQFNELCTVSAIVNTKGKQQRKHFRTVEGCTRTLYPITFTFTDLVNGAVPTCILYICCTSGYMVPRISVLGKWPTWCTNSFLCIYLYL